MKSIAVIEGDGSLLVAVQRGDLDLKKDKRAKELAIADNRVAELDLEWNPEVLASLDADLKEFWNESEFTKVLGEFGTPPLEAPEPKLDQAAALQRKWKTARGQIWEIGKHRLVCGDATDEKAVGALLSGHTPPVCVTDPPYGVDYDPGWRDEAAAKGYLSYAPRRTGKVANDRRIDWSDAWKLCPGAVIYCWHAGRNANQVQQSLEAAGFTIRSQIIWAKPIFPISRPSPTIGVGEPGILRFGLD